MGYSHSHIGFDRGGHGVWAVILWGAMPAGNMKVVSTGRYREAEPL